jgi:hypothetical protein
MIIYFFIYKLKMTTKKCSKCKIQKEKNEFYVKSKNKDGLCGQCKKCYDKQRRGSLDLESFDEEKKRCTDCINYKTYSEFNKRKDSKDGYRNQCSECYNTQKLK